jgi:hypothetical protein
MLKPISAAKTPGSTKKGPPPATKPKPKPKPKPNLKPMPKLLQPSANLPDTEDVEELPVTGPGLALSLFDYAAEKDDELCFDVDTTIVVERLEEDGWCAGHILAADGSKGAYGLFPANFVRALPATLHPPTSSSSSSSTPEMQTLSQPASPPQLSAPKAGSLVAAKLGAGAGLPMPRGTPTASSPPLPTPAAGSVHSTPTGGGGARDVLSTPSTPPLSPSQKRLAEPPLSPKFAIPPPPAAVTTEAAATGDEQDVQQLATALYRYEATNADEASFAEGATLEIVTRMGDGR